MTSRSGPFLSSDHRPLSHSFFEGPSLKTLCKLAVIQYNLDQSCLPHDIRYSEWLERRDWLRVSGQHRHDLKKHELCLSMEETELFVLLEM